MSNANSKSPKPPGRITRLLQKLGFITKAQAEEVEQAVKSDPSMTSRGFMLRKGWVTEDQIEKVTKDPDSCCPKSNFSEARESMGETITQSVRLTDVATAIAKKSRT